MAYSHRLQTSRYEFKYVVDEPMAGAIRDFVRGYLVPDEHILSDQHEGYLVQSLYLDTPNLSLYRQTIHGIKNRFKLRIRFYDRNPTGLAFLEIKRRTTDVIRKERTAVVRERVSRLLDGYWPDHSHVVGDGAKAIDTLRQFCSLRDDLDARGNVYVSYLREPYVLPESNQVRVTFDRQVAAGRYVPNGGLEMPRDVARTNIEGVILELKFTDRFPTWMRELVQTFDLTRRSVPKYVKCVQALSLSPSPWVEQPWSIAR